MNYFSRCVEVLELKKVLKKVSEFACFDETKSLILNLVPCTNLEMVREKLNETDEAMAFLERSEGLDLFEVKNPVQCLKKAKAGSFLSPAELLNIGSILKQARHILKFYEKSSGFINHLNKHFLNLFSIDSIENEIFKSIESEEFVSDEASSNLKNIRTSIVAKKSQIKNILQNLINGPKQQYIQENIITTRNGRYVLPVKSQFASRFSGLVQDVSSTKATVFIEPAEVVGCCNELKILMGEEKLEIELILKNLSLSCLTYFEEIERNYFVMLDFDLIFAKAKFSLNFNCNKPEVFNDGTINLVSARHPLIDQSKVVPINIAFGGKLKNLIVSGPNTGGKTVALKTVGLLVLMAMCGLLIPSSRLSKISIFKKILVLIGDEQSIESSLSTFSAHMKNLAEILNQVDGKSLVLIDELCGGTDPQQGAALAVAVVETLCGFSASFAVTTHYIELKMFALKNKMVENASFEFDETLLIPTYRLETGFFGQSSAFQISRKIGISSLVINRARQLIDDKRLEFDKAVENLNRMKLKYEKNLKVQSEQLNELNKLKLSLEEQQNKLNFSAKDYLDKARFKANEALNSVKIQANAILSELKVLNKQIKNDENIKKALARVKSISKNSANKLVGKFDFGVEMQNGLVDRAPQKLQKGDEVLIYDLNKKGTVLEVFDKKQNVLVEVGNIKTRINMNRLKVVQSADKKAKTSLSVSKSTISKKLRKIETSVDLRGQTAIDAIFMVDRAIDSCVLNNVSVLTIIHGKGTGVLRNAVFKHLKSHRNVKTQRLGDYYEGGDGVTVVELQ